MSVIETKRLIIREYSHDDIEKLNIILSNSTTMSFWPTPFTLERTEAWVRNNMRRYKELGYGRWALISKDTGELIGDCGIITAEIDGKQEQDLGYIINHPYWKNGFATEAAGACKEFALNDLGIKRLCANMAFNHEGSRKVAEKIGMEKEKEFYNKRNRDILTYLYSISNNA